MKIDRAQLIALIHDELFEQAGKLGEYCREAETWDDTKEEMVCVTDTVSFDGNIDLGRIADAILKMQPE